MICADLNVKSVTRASDYFIINNKWTRMFFLILINIVISI